ncbi:cytochrome b [Bergeriella denitrificans]|uniref:Putative cytochrome B561 n=1 Tax=Bergeriella denitrificans TaxID=494 RepID=A0A378UEH0_BERDE|nr:cytochrome b [Bergeriella denitrificans]STZ75808.1 putative cytochrome B561 [Bergeriella denitrificans]
MNDTPQYYGTISRLLHWLMALGFAFMAVIAALFATDDKYYSLMDYHKLTGYFLFILFWVRLAWACANRSRRPHNDLAARLGHAALYVLMFAVPFIGLLRQYGNARGPLEFGGMTLLPAAAEKITWMTELGGAAHGKLGWLLFALAAGHILMAVLHQIQGKKILNRMAGPRR